MVRYLDPADHHPARITKVDEDFARKLNFKDIKHPSKLEIFTKLKKSVFSYAKKKKNPTYVLKNILKRHVDLTGENRQKALFLSRLCSYQRVNHIDV